MKLIVGLGNPGTRFAWTRHNFGFLALDFYLKRYHGSWSEKPRLSAIFAEIEPNLAGVKRSVGADGGSQEAGKGSQGVEKGSRGAKEKVFLLKPQDFYNLSGKAVAAWVKYYKVDLSDILVICDNFDLEFGKIRYRSSGSSGGNNGLKSVDQELGTSAYPRLRLGTENTLVRGKMSATGFVLGKFTPEEKARLPEILEEVCRKIDEFIVS